MATMSVRPEQALIVELGRLHPDYTISIFRLPSRQYPILNVRNDRYECNTEIRLAETHWTVAILDRLVIKAATSIEKLAHKKGKK